MRRCLDLPDPFPVRVVVATEDGSTPADRVDALGPYAEAYWLPHVGPSAYLAARRLLLTGDATWSKEVLAAALGIGHNTGRNSTLERALARLESFRLARDVGDVLYVSRHWPRLPDNLLLKMPPGLRVGESEMFAA